MPPIVPSDATMNMLQLTFPCYFSDNKRDIEIAKFRKGDPDIKTWIREEMVSSAFVDILLEYYKVIPYDILKANRKEYVSLDDKADDYALIKSLFVFGREGDCMHTGEINDVLLRYDITMNSKKMKTVLEKFGAVNSTFRKNGRNGKGYCKISLKVEDVE